MLRVYTGDLPSEVHWVALLDLRLFECYEGLNRASRRLKFIYW